MKFVLICYWLINYNSSSVIGVLGSFVIKGKYRKVNGFEYITIPLCLGIPPQCFNMLYDNKQTMLFVCSSALSDKVINTFDEHKSETYEPIEERTYQFISGDRNINGNQVMDYLDYGTKRKLSWLLMTEMNFHIKDYFDGIVGFAKDNFLGPEFSFLHTLIANGKTHNFNYGHSFITPNEVEVYFGQEPFGFSEYKACDTRSPIYWYCKSYSISMTLGNEVVMIDKSGRDIVFDIGAQYLDAPNEGKPVLEIYMSILKGHCEMMADQLKRRSYLQCDAEYVTEDDIKAIPDVDIKVNDALIKLKAVDLFERSGTVFKVKLMIKDNGLAWVLNQVVLKNYNMNFDDVNSKIWFKENEMLFNKEVVETTDTIKNKGSEVKSKWMYYILILLCLSGIWLLLFVTYTKANVIYYYTIFNKAYY